MFIPCLEFKIMLARIIGKYLMYVNARIFFNKYPNSFIHLLIQSCIPFFVYFSNKFAFRTTCSRQGPGVGGGAGMQGKIWWSSLCISKVHNLAVRTENETTDSHKCYDGKMFSAVTWYIVWQKGREFDRLPGESAIKFDTSMTNRRQAAKRGKSVPYGSLINVGMRKISF